MKNFFKKLHSKKTSTPGQSGDDHFRSMADEAPVLMWTSSRNDISRNYFNKYWFSFTGRSLHEERGKGWQRGIHPNDSNEFIGHYQEAFSQQKQYKSEYRLRIASGEYRRIVETGAPRFDDSGTFLGYIGSCVDITEFKKLDKIKNEFVNMVSHELRSPLALIKEGVSQVISGIEGPISEEQNKVLSVALEGINRLGVIVDDILDISKVELGKLSLKKKIINIVKITETVAAGFKSQIENKEGLALKEVYSTDAIHVFADKNRMIQVLTNLLVNAVKFTDKGSITISISENEKEIICNINDTGKGIPEEDLSKVFGKFEQFNRQLSSSVKGTGLGFAICKGIIEAHSGTISVKSALNQGASFVFTLPKHTPMEIFKEYVQLQLELAQRDQGPLSVVMFNTQGFDALKDSISAEKHVYYVMRLEEIIEKSLRRVTDTLVKDNDCFMLILPFTPKEGALAVKGRLIRVMDEFLRKNAINEQVSIEAKVINYPHDVKTCDGFIEQVM